MIVSELIEKLKDEDPSALVLIDDDGFYREPQLSREPIPEGQPAVIL